MKHLQNIDIVEIQDRYEINKGNYSKININVGTHQPQSATCYDPAAVSFYA